MQGFSKPQLETFARIGMAIMLAQAAEKTISMTLRLALPKDGVHSIEELTKPESKATLGQLLAKLRSRADLDERFGSCFEEFLTKRNALVHDVNSIPGWSLNTEEGISVANIFLERLMQLSQLMFNVFLGLLRAWQEESGAQADLPRELEEMLNEVDRRYKPIVSNIFFAKKAPQGSQNNDGTRWPLSSEIRSLRFSPSRCAS